MRSNQVRLPVVRGDLEARRLVDKRTIELARLRWTLEDQTRRLQRSTRWLEGGAEPTTTELPPTLEQSPTPADAGRRKVQIRVTESREVSITLEEDAAADAPDVIEHPRRPTP